MSLARSSSKMSRGQSSVTAIQSKVGVAVTVGIAAMQNQKVSSNCGATTGRRVNQPRA